MAKTDDFETDDIDIADDSADSAMDAPAVAPVKKRGGVKIVLILVILAGGFFAFRQFGAPLLAQLTGAPVPATPVEQAATSVAEAVTETPASTETATAEETPAEISVVPPSSETTAEASAEPAAETGATADPLSWNAPAASPADAAPVETPPADVAATPSTEPAVETPAAENTLAAPAEVPPAEITPDTGAAESATDASAIPTPESIAPVSPSTEPEPAVPVATEAPAETAPLSQDQIALRMDALEKRLTQIDEAVIALQQNLATKSDIDSLRESLAKIESQKKDSAPKEEAPVAAEAPSEKTSAEASAVLHEEPAPAPVKEVSRIKKPAAPKKETVTRRWVLKSAKPGTAWVAESGSGEMKTVSVGDTLSGIGTITSISQDSNGRWVVNGSKGRINQ